MTGKSATVEIIKKGGDVVLDTITGVTDINKGIVDGTIALEIGPDTSILLAIASDEILIITKEGAK